MAHKTQKRNRNKERRTVHGFGGLETQDVFSGVLDGFDDTRHCGPENSFGANGRKVNALGEEAVYGREVRKSVVLVGHHRRQRRRQRVKHRVERLRRERQLLYLRKALVPRHIKPRFLFLRPRICVPISVFTNH